MQRRTREGNIKLLINLRGTHGTGKTHVSHRLILENQHNELVEPEYVRGKHFVKPNCYSVEGGLHILGRWRSGMDGIFPQEIVEDIIEYWAPQPHVLWENVMVSANVGRWAVLSHRLEPMNHNVWAFIDTPLDLCIERVFSRRAESAADGFSHRQEDSEVKLDVLAQHWRRCRRAAVRAVKDGIDVRWISHDTAYEQVHDLFVGAGWEPGGEMLLPEITPRWYPTDEECEYVLKTAILPWEPADMQTKVDFVSPPTSRKRRPAEVFGVRVARWGGGYDDPDVELDASVFGLQVMPWPATPDTIPAVPYTGETLGS